MPPIKAIANQASNQDTCKGRRHISITDQIIFMAQADGKKFHQFH
jgi:hypothetical protein